MIKRTCCLHRRYWLFGCSFIIIIMFVIDSEFRLILFSYCFIFQFKQFPNFIKKYTTSDFLGLMCLPMIYRLLLIVYYVISYLALQNFIWYIIHRYNRGSLLIGILALLLYIGEVSIWRNKCSFFIMLKLHPNRWSWIMIIISIFL